MANGNGCGITRREWLLGAASAVSAPWWPPAAHAVHASKAVAAGATLTLRSATAQAAAPFAAGLAFARGEFPAQADLVCALPGVDVHMRSRWPDGSARYAVVCGQAALQADQPLALTFNAGTATAAPALTEADLAATGIDATLEFAPFGSVSLAALIGVASTYDGGAQRWSAGRVRTCYAGANGASWLYYARIGSDVHLSAWFEVRLWAGGAVEVLAWIENGWLRVAAPGARSGTARLVVGGTQRYSGALTLPHHARAVLGSGTTVTHWLGVDPALDIRHSTAQLQQTRLVPAYRAQTAASSPLLGRLANSYTPLARGNFPDAMGSTGYSASIGLLPEWDVAYLTSAADPRAQRAVLINALCAGRYGIHYRDEQTNAPLRASQHPNLVLNSTHAGVTSIGSSTTNTRTPAPVDGGLPNWATSHHPSVGYLAYLLTGRWYCLEQLQFAATLNHLKQTDSIRGYGQGVLRTDSGTNTTRGAAWALRTLMQAASATPDDAALRTELLDSVAANIRYYHARYVARPNNPQGICTPYSDYTPGEGVYMHAIWMEDFLTAAFGYLQALQLPLPDDVNAQLRALFEWKARSIVGRFGVQGEATAYNYRDAGQFTLAVAPSDTADWNSGNGPWYADWGQILQATTGAANTPSFETALRNSYFPDPTGAWGNLQPALAYAVTFDVPGARAAYERMTNASNWLQFVALCNDKPVWGVEPHAEAGMAGEVFGDGFESG